MNWLSKVFGRGREEKRVQQVMDPKSWEEWDSPHGFSFRFPAGWVQVPDDSIILRPLDAASFVCSEGRETEEVFSPALTLMMYPRGKTEGKMPDEVFQSCKRSAASVFRGYEHQGDEVFRIATGQQAYAMRYRFLKCGRPFEGIAAYIITPKDIFVFDGSGLREIFAAYESILLQSICSLRVQ